MERLIDSATFHIVPPPESLDEHAISLERLEEIARGLGEVFAGFADDRIIDEADDRLRSKPAKAAKNHYKIFIKPLIQGSFALPCELYDIRDTPENQAQLFDNEANFGTLAKLISLVADNNQDEFYSNIKSPVVAAKILNGIEKLASKDGDEVYFTYGEGQQQQETISSNVAPRIIEWRSLCFGPFEEEIIATISSIDFENNNIRLRPLKSARKFSADINEELSTIPLGDVRGKKWKVLCDVTYTPNGMIDHIDNVKSLEELILRELLFEGFDIDDRHLEFKEPLCIKEELDDETASLFVAAIPQLCIDVYAEYQDELVERIADELGNKWSWIVECDDDSLTPRAQAVKQTFLDMVKTPLRSEN